MSGAAEVPSSHRGTSVWGVSTDTGVRDQLKEIERVEHVNIR